MDILIILFSLLYTKFISIAPQSNLDNTTLSLATTTKFNSINPLGIIGTPIGETTRLLFDNLAQPSPYNQNSYNPLIAKKWLIKKNSITFFINPKSNLYSSDIKFSYLTLKNKSNPYFRQQLQSIQKVNIINKYTIIFYLKNPQKNFSLIATMPIMPKNSWQTVNFASPLKNININTSGAYKVTYFKPYSSIVLTKKNHYWAQNLKSRKNMYSYKAIKYNFYSNKNLMLQYLCQNKIDILQIQNPKNLNKYLQNPCKNSHLITFPHHRIMPLNAFFINTNLNKFKDINLRKALYYALDLNYINKKIMHNYLQISSSIFENSPYKASNQPNQKEKDIMQNNLTNLNPNILKQPVPTKKSSLTLAEEFLNKTNWHIKNGLRVNQEGKKLTINIFIKNPDMQIIGQIFALNLKELGITANIIKIDNNEYANYLKNKNYEIIDASLYSSNPPSLEQKLYWSDKGSFNISNLNNSNINYIVSQLLKTKNKQEKITYARTLDRIIRWQYIFIPTFYNNVDYYIINQSIKYPSKTPTYGADKFLWSKETRRK